MDLVARWVELLRLEGARPEYEIEATQDELVSDSFAAIRSRGSERAALVHAFQEAVGCNEALRQAIGSVLLPPFQRAALDPDVYRSHPEVDFDTDRMPVRVALGLPVAEDFVEAGSNPLEFGRSWFAGQPAVPVGTSADWVWPTRSDGAPLTHVVQVDLATEALNQGIGSFSRTGLPTDGVLQLFHDLQTFGWDVDDDTNAWRLVWHAVEDPGAEDDLELVKDAPLAATPAFPANPQLLATVPSPLDLADASDEEWARYERAALWLEQSAYEMNMAATNSRVQLTPWDNDYEPCPPVSRMGGFGVAESNPELRGVLARHLPLADGDSHILVLDVNPLAITDTGALLNWFHTRHLEVWMRRSDLDARRFNDVRCVIRTDN